MDTKLKLAAIEQQIMPHLKRARKLRSSKGNELVYRDRAVLDADKLKAAVSTQVWTQITSRKPVSLLIAVAIRRGLLTRKLVQQCSHRSQPWIAISATETDVL